MAIADVNDLILVGIPTKVIRTAGISFTNEMHFSAREGIIIIEETGKTAEETEQSGNDHISDECREKLENEREAE